MLLRFDLNKKCEFHRLTILSKDKAYIERYIKVCTSPKVSWLSPESLKSLKNVFEKVEFFSCFVRSADGCLAWLEDAVHQKNFYVLQRFEPKKSYKERKANRRCKESTVILKILKRTVTLSTLNLFLNAQCTRNGTNELNNEPTKVLCEGLDPLPLNEPNKSAEPVTNEPNEPNEPNENNVVPANWSVLYYKLNEPNLLGLNGLDKYAEPVTNEPNEPNENKVELSVNRPKVFYELKGHNFLNGLSLNSLQPPTKHYKRTLKILYPLPAVNDPTRTDERSRVESHLVRSGSVELNPGPEDPAQDNRQKRRQTASMAVTSYNVRGLNDERKLRHLINCLYKTCGGKNTDFVACLQETYLEKEGKIPYLWRGNFYLTPGNGHSCGVLTLLSTHISVIEGRSIDSRAHILACQKTGESGALFLIANIYAPNPNSNEKIEFFEKIFDVLQEFKERFNSKKCILAGDFNLNFSESEIKNRLYSSQEKRIAKLVQDLADDFGLADSWEKKQSYTWRRPNSEIFSTIDKILFSKETLKLKECTSNWALSFSDHAAVEATFDYPNETSRTRSRIVRLDPTLAKDPKTSASIVEGVEEMMRSVPNHWNPHQQLEFLKMCVRTVVEKVQSDRKKKELNEEEMLNEELEVAVGELARGAATHNRQGLVDYIEELRIKKSIIVENKGRRLAERLGTRWYNEGEKSTRYFMRLLNRTNPDRFNKMENSNGEVVTDEDEVQAEIVKFYKGLYENFDTALINQDDDDFFQGVEGIGDGDDQELGQDITEEELRQTLLTCSDSAPGPDGIPYSIIGLLWSRFGPILTSAWKFSLESRTLAPSHKVSYLKLIPKAGKNLEKLTNWRPISLSNCDHKIITKAYAKRLCMKVAPKIGEAQTAYLKGRLINDNLRAMLSTIEISRLEEIEGLIVALDAKKAFDSVSHDYIEKCLKEFGCTRFIPIFRTLYKDLNTDILINGKIVKGFKIRRGVKQGDALSCILFIICMEPLLRNIERNPNIVPLTSALVESNLPKSYSYADDVSCTISDNEESLKELFKEYERLTRMSGLELNADKTELMKIGTGRERSYKVEYLGRSYEVATSESVKLNGLFFHRNKEVMRQRNVNEALGKMDSHFKSWSRRNLSTLGRILIVKSFGVSQIIYLMQSMELHECDYKKINALLFKFIWNRHYLAAKAPERVKREIVNKPIKYGGYGMLDVAKLDESLKIKALGRLTNSLHPFLLKLKAKLDLKSFFDPKCGIDVDGVLNKGIQLLKRDRDKLWSCNELNSHKNLMRTIRALKIKEVLNGPGKLSLTFFIINRQAQTIGEINLGQLTQLERFIRPDKLEKLKLAIRLNDRGTVENSFNESYMIGTIAKPLPKCTSKEIRTQRSDCGPIISYKIGLELTNSEALSWGFKISKLTSTRHKATLLRVSHGDVYTKEKLNRFGLIDASTCPRCNEIEDIKHKVLECQYAKKIWVETYKLLNEPTDQITIASILGAEINQTLVGLTVRAEILTRILSLRDDQTYLLHPKYLAKLSIGGLAKKEIKKDIANGLCGILSVED